MPTPPSGFVRTLGLLDPLLSLRWGEGLGQWVVERKAVNFLPSEKGYMVRRRERLGRLHAANPNDVKTRDKFRNVCEEVISMQDGKRVILFTRDLNSHVYDALCLANIQKYGGYSRYCDKLEAEEEATEARLERAQANRREDASREMFEQVKFIENKKLSRMITGHKDLNSLLHG